MPCPALHCCTLQAALLGGGWAPLFILSLAQWESSGLQDGLLRATVHRISQLALDHTEFTCLKALVLFNPEQAGLAAPLQVEVLQDQTHLMLQEYCAAKQQSASKVRFGRLLLLLPALNKFSKQVGGRHMTVYL